MLGEGRHPTRLRPGDRELEEASLRLRTVGPVAPTLVVRHPGWRGGTAVVDTRAALA